MAIWDEVTHPHMHHSGTSFFRLIKKIVYSPAARCIDPMLFSWCASETFGFKHRVWDIGENDVFSKCQDFNPRKQVISWKIQHFVYGVKGNTGSYDYIFFGVKCPTDRTRASSEHHASDIFTRLKKIKSVYRASNVHRPLLARFSRDTR